MNTPAQTGVIALQDMEPPKGFNRDRWHELVADAFSFRRMWGAQAVDLGWTPLELFGMSRTHPWALHAWGAVPFINGKKVVEVTDTTIWVETGRETIDPHTGEVTANRLRISKRKMGPTCVHAWEL